MAVPVKIFCGFLYKDGKIYEEAKARLEERFGPVDCESRAVPFDFTDYYEKELGPGLTRSFASFAALLPPENSREWKIFTNTLEQRFVSRPASSSRPVISAAGGKHVPADSKRGPESGRKINVDSGCLDLARVVLFSTKDYYHRIYLGRGIYAEVTLHWERGSFHVFPWTYPDYRTDFALEFFRAVRDKYRRQLKD